MKAFGRIHPALRAKNQEEALDWEAVYRQELPRVYNYFRYRLGDGPQAEDLTAATFEKAWRNRVRYRHDLSGFSTWLLTIAARLAVDHYRRNRPTVPLEDLEAGPAPHHAGPALEEQVQGRLEAAHLGSLLAGLPEREQELISLKYGAELTHREIAALTGLSETNVGTLLHRAVQKLRKAWER
jgi:RNA polymerase sigma-70 factor (ECF subfamily)